MILSLFIGELYQKPSFWVLVVLIAGRVFLLLDFFTWQQENMHICVHTNPSIYIYTTMNISIYIHACIPIYVITSCWYVHLDTSKAFSFFFNFQVWHDVSNCGFLFMWPIWYFWSYLNEWLNDFQWFWKMFAQYLFNCYFCPSILTFWDSSGIYSRFLYYVLHVFDGNVCFSWFLLQWALIWIFPLEFVLSFSLLILSLTWSNILTLLNPFF